MSNEITMKNVLQSRTVWLAIIQAVAAVMIAVFTTADMPAYVLMVKSGLDILLRLNTNTMIK